MAAFVGESYSAFCRTERILLSREKQFLDERQEFTSLLEVFEHVLRRPAFRS